MLLRKIVSYYVIRVFRSVFILVLLQHHYEIFEANSTVFSASKRVASGARIQVSFREKPDGTSYLLASNFRPDQLYHRDLF